MKNKYISYSLITIIIHSIIAGLIFYNNNNSHDIPYRPYFLGIILWNFLCIILFLSILVLTSIISYIIHESTNFFNSNFLTFISISLIVLGIMNIIMEFDLGMIIWASLFGILPGIFFILIGYRIRIKDKLNTNKKLQ